MGSTPMRDNGLVNREERIEKARQMAAERRPQRQDDVPKRAARVHQRLSDVGAAQAQRHVTAAERSDNVTFLGPERTPREWAQAVELARLITIRRAKRRDTITYGEIKWAVYDDLNMLVDLSMFTSLVNAVDHEPDGVLLSSVIVHDDDGKPGEGFMPYARELGFDLPLEDLQRQVYEHFT